MASMTRKHFEMIASNIRTMVDRNNMEGADLQSRSYAIGELRILAHSFAADFRQENVNFDTERFMRACGF